MRKFYYDFTAVLALLFLLVYSYFSFMGMLYIFEGEIWKALLFTFIVFFLVVGCVYVMTMAKMAKFKGIGLAGQIIFGVIMLGVFISASIPFTSFIYANQHGDEIKECVEETKKTAIGMNNAYYIYVDQRLADYKKMLIDSIPYTQTSEITPYEEIMLLTTSFHRQLAPPSLDTIQREREKWVENLSGMSTWNILLPANLNRIKNCVGEWLTEYIELSDKSFSDSKFELFEYDDFSSAMAQLVDRLKGKRVSLWAILAALFCFVMMLLPYLKAESIPMPSSKENENRNNNNYEIPIE